MDAITLMCHNEAKPVGHRLGVECGLVDKTRHINPGSGAKCDRCVQLMNLSAYLSVTLQLEDEKRRRLEQRKSGFLRVPVSNYLL